MFSVVFIIEMILKIMGLGFKNYFEDIFNIFDCFIAMVALFDLVVSSAFTSINVDAVNTLRTFRLLRLFKLARTWKQFNHLLATMGKTLKEISAFSVVLFLFMFIYSILGMEMFAYKAMYDASGNLDMVTGESVDQNFDSFLWSFTTVFVLLTEDGWSTVYQLYHVAVGGWRANLYFLSLFIIGPRILLNIFLAILMENFENDSLDQQ
jgi:voltage-dependent calcium channel L type alpha-1D